MTRRTFMGTAGSVAASLTVSTSAAVKLNLGIGTYTYHSLSIDDMITQLKRLEIHEIEMSHGPFMLFSHPSAEKFETARSKFDTAGIRCVSYYAATIKDDADLGNAVRFAKLLSARNITGDATGD